MATRNIQMNYYNGSSYDQLYPQTLLSNVSNWNNSIYSKSEVDNIINSNIEDVKENLTKQLQIPNFVQYQTKRINGTITSDSKSSSDKTIAKELFPSNTFYCYEDIIITASGSITMEDEKNYSKNLKLITSIRDMSYTYTFISQSSDIRLSFSGSDTKSIFLIKYGFGMNNIGGGQITTESDITAQYGIDLFSIYYDHNDTLDNYSIFYKNLYNGIPIKFSIDYTFVDSSSSNVGTLNYNIIFTLYKRTNPLVTNMFSLNT